jgi:hypothetical protein
MVSLIYNVFFIVVQTASGSQGPPPPANRGGTRGAQLPIDDNIWLLIVLGVLFGIYIIYRRNQATNKAA